MLRPERLANGLLHFPTNVQATSAVERALDIAECGGLVSVKAHLLARAGSYRALDGLTVEYREHLHRVLTALANRYGDSLWWTSMGEMSRRMAP
jgi:predicted ATP-grasp superfamily ATP-dependent carboligase